MSPSVAHQALYDEGDQSYQCDSGASGKDTCLTYTQQRFIRFNPKSLYGREKIQNMC